MICIAVPRPPIRIVAVMLGLAVLSEAIAAEADGDEPVPQRGERLFQTYCSTCHGRSESPVGPSLHGVGTSASFEWISRFVRNPQAVVDAKDERALLLVEKYKVLMPGFPFLSDPEIASILDYARANERDAVDPSKRDQERIRWKALMTLPTEPIPHSGYFVRVEDYVTAPPSSDRPPLARISNLRFRPGEMGNRFYVIDQNGPLYTVEDGVISKVLDVAVQFPYFVRTPGLATGFGCMAFHPDYRANGRIYISHTEKSSPVPTDFALGPKLPVQLQYVISELTVTDPQARELKGAWRELLRLDMPHQIHGVQELCFRPDIGPADPDFGLLYISIGDGGSTARSAYGLCESLATPLGSILRIDPLGKGGRKGRYGIPVDNPFAALAKSDHEIWPEIYAKGFRNPHRLAWEPEGARRLIATDIGQSSFEEINFIEPGAFYGWNQREGYVVFDRDRRQLTESLLFSGPRDAYKYPAALYSHNEGFAISGGYIYSGEFEPLRGKYIFGDISTGRLFFADLAVREKGIAQIYELGIRTAEGKTTKLSELVGGNRVDLRFGVDAHGQWYLLSKTDGVIRRIIHWE